MTLQLTRTQYVDAAGGHAVKISSFITLSAAGNPAYLVVNALDRNEYTAAATCATGQFSGNGHTLGLTPDGSDGREGGIVYTWSAAAHAYVNATYGTLSQLSWSDPTSANDVTNISFFGTNDALTAQYYAADVFSLAQVDAVGYLGSVTFASDTATAGAGSASASQPSGNATPLRVAMVAKSLVGQDWNENGCWVLASTIAAEAGSGLPVQSTMLGVPGAANGPWYVAYDGPAGSTGNWRSLVTVGDMVSFQTSATSGHITTCVAGSGASAQIVDNVTYEDGDGSVTNLANDGSANDVVIAPQHLASAEFAGVSASSVVIYALDTPVVHDVVSAKTLGAGATLALAGLFSASDPLHKSIAAFQVYLANADDGLQVNGVATASSAAAPITVASLSSLDLVAGHSAGVDEIAVRAFNGAYWGDWQGLSVSVASTHGLTVTPGTTSDVLMPGVFHG